MIKALIFDFSGVCSNLEEPPFLRKFAVKNKLKVEEFEKAYQELLIKAERDEISGAEVWRKLSKIFSFKVDIKQVIWQMISEKKYDLEMLGFIKQLRAKYQVGMFSNYNKDYWDLIARQIDLKPYFDKVIISYQIKARKDEKTGFQIFLDDFKLSPEEVVYIDDSAEKLLVPAKMGLKTILFKNKVDLINKLMIYRVKYE